MKTRFNTANIEQLVMLAGSVAKIISVSGGWTTLDTESGDQLKVRNGTIRPLTQEEFSQIKVKKMNEERQARQVMPARVIAPGEKRAKIGNIEFDMSGYYISDRKANGRRSVDCNDGVAEMLRNASIEEIYEIASRETGISVEELQSKYAKLNTGMQRMNLGNVIRGRLKAKAKAAAEVTN